MTSHPLPLFAAEAEHARPPRVLSYGAGIDSTAVLTGWRQRGIRPDLVMFADTGSEHRGTYAYLPLISAWLAAAGFPPLTVVRYRPRHGRYTTLIEDCLLKGVLPSLAYGSKACSQKWKAQPQNAFLRSWPPALAAWSRGLRLEHAIGYDAGPKDMRRGSDGMDNELETFIYPLREWGWDRMRCMREIEGDELLARLAGKLDLPQLPPKSACVCCPSTPPREIDEMAVNEREELAAALAIEAAARPTLRSIEGLWRRTTRQHPGSWATYTEGLPGVEPAAADVMSRLPRCTDAEIATAAPPDGRRYAVRSAGTIHYSSGFGDALQAAGDGPIHAWIDGAWFTSSSRRHTDAATPLRPPS